MVRRTRRPQVAQVWQKTMSARFEDYRDTPKGSDSVAQGIADWRQAITELAEEKTKQRLEQAHPVVARVVKNLGKMQSLVARLIQIKGMGTWSD